LLANAGSTWSAAFLERNFTTSARRDRVATRFRSDQQPIRAARGPGGRPIAATACNCPSVAAGRARNVKSSAKTDSAVLAAALFAFSRRASIPRLFESPASDTVSFLAPASPADSVTISSPQFGLLVLEHLHLDGGARPGAASHGSRIEVECRHPDAPRIGFTTRASVL
jgi:hypothetical protein